MKSLLKNSMLDSINVKMQEAKSMLDDALSAVANDSKSTAGDKHETSRAMAQIEQENAAKKLAQLKTEKQRIQALEVNEDFNRVEVGAVVETNVMTFYLSLGLGRLEIDSKIIYAIAPGSPIGQAMIGKKIGDTFTINGKEQTIKNIQ